MTGIGPVGRLGLHQLRELLPFLVYELEVGRMAGEPEDELVEEQDQSVVAETGGVLAEDREPLVEREECLAVGPGLGVVRAEELADERADEL